MTDAQFQDQKSNNGVTCEKTGYYDLVCIPNLISKASSECDVAQKLTSHATVLFRRRFDNRKYTHKTI